MPYLFAGLVLVAPLYVWRFSIGGLPTNFLMLANFFVMGVGFVLVLQRKDDWQAKWKKFNHSLLTLGKPLPYSIAAFGLASLISLFAFGITGEKLAQWVVLYVQPLVLFFLLRYFTTDQVGGNSARHEKTLRYISAAAYAVVGLAGALALIQYATLWTLPMQWWGNANEPKRAIAFFAHANAYGLFVTPLLAWLIPDFMLKIRNRLTTGTLVCVIAWVCGAMGVFLSLSRGAWLGLTFAAAIYVLLSANKKMLIGAGLVALLLAGIIAAVPNLRYRVILPFLGEKSSAARISLWHTASLEIADNPILGKGVNGFSDNWDKYNTDSGLDHYNFPHNILLNFWVDLGLLGLLSMLSILMLTAWHGFKQRADIVKFGLLLFILALTAHGLIDIPYLKNDLALIFWLILAISL